MFPTPIFSTLLAVLFFGTFIIDYLVPKFSSPEATRRPVLSGDRSSYVVIQIAGLVAILMAFLCRYMGWGIVPGWAQWLGLAIGAFGLFFREWAVIRLGQYFSRVVEIEAGHRLVTDGPYRRIRHPAYTGMILVDFGIALAIGSWIGALLALVIVLSAVLYRINVEEALLIRAFGDEYRRYMAHTWQLFPGF